jgi:hypothetical protein
MGVRQGVWILLLVAACQPADKKVPPPTEGPASGTLKSATPMSDASISSAPSDQAVPRPVPPLPDPLPGKRTALTIATPHRAAIGDLDGDHHNEIVVCDPTVMTVLDPSGKKLGELSVVDGIQRLVVADVDGDGRAEIYAGWGQTREHMDTKAHLSVLRFDPATRLLREEQILQPATTRNDIVSILPAPDLKALYFSYFDSKYMVTTVLVSRAGDGWTQKPVVQNRMAASFARGDVDGDGKLDLVVGRVYGDDKGVDGDAFVQGMGADAKRTMIPSQRGLRSIAVIDGAVYMGDGWHQNYGTLGRGLLSRSKIVSGAFVTNVVEDTAGQYALEAIIPATVDKKRVIVTQGSNYTRAFRLNGDKWEALTIAGVARDVAVGDLDGKPGDEILIVGDKTEIVNLEGVTWSPIP